MYYLRTTDSGKEKVQLILFLCLMLPLQVEKREKLIYGQFIFYSFSNFFLSVVTEISRQVPSPIETKMG